jgi:hypothetical protein
LKTVYDVRILPGSYKDVLDDLKPFISDLASHHELMDELGGNVYILEEEAELESIEVYDLDHGNGTLLTMPGSFDMAERFAGDWVKVMNVTSDLGGAIYYIPPAIADLNDHVSESIDLSNC